MWQSDRLPLPLRTSQMARVSFFCGRFAIKPDDKKLNKTRLPQITLKFMQQKESYLSWPLHDASFQPKNIYGQDLALQCNMIWTFILSRVDLFLSITVLIFYLPRKKCISNTIRPFCLFLLQLIEHFCSQKNSNL